MPYKTIKLLFICLLFNYYASAQHSAKIDSLKKELIRVEGKTGRASQIVKIKIMDNLAWNYQHTNSDSSLNISLKALKMAETINDTVDIAEACNQIGYAYMKLGKRTLALENYQRSIKAHQVVGNKKGEGNALNNIGIMYYRSGDYANSLTYYLKAAKIRETIGDKYGIASCYGNMGIIYDAEGNHPKAVEYYEKALPLFESIGDNASVSGILSNLAGVYVSQKKYKMALESYLKVLQINIKLNDKHNQATSYNNIGNVYATLNQNDRALDYFKKSLKLKEEIGDKPGIALAFFNIGSIFAHNGGMKDEVAENLNGDIPKLQFINPGLINTGIDWTLKGLKLAKETDFQDLVKDSYANLALMYATRKQYDKAYIYHKLYKAANDTIFNQENSEKIAEMNIKYETEKKDNSIKQLEQDQQINALKAQDEKQKNNIRLGLLSGFLLVSAGGSLYWYNRNKAKNRELHLQAALQAEEIKRKQIEAELKLQQEKERISRDLHDSVGSQLTYIISQLDYTSAIADGNEGVQAKINNVSDNARELMQMLREIIWAIQKEELSLSDFSFKIKELLARYQSSFPAINFTYEFDEANADKASLNPNQLLNLFRIIQEAITNSIKHARAHHISVALAINEQGDLQLNVSDDGEGMADVQSKVGHYGLGNMKTRAEEMHGQFSISSDPGKGTIISIALKLA